MWLQPPGAPPFCVSRCNLHSHTSLIGALDLVGQYRRFRWSAGRCVCVCVCHRHTACFRWWCTWHVDSACCGGQEEAGVPSTS